MARVRADPSVVASLRLPTRPSKNSKTMTRRIRSTIFSRAIQRTLKVVTRALRPRKTAARIRMPAKTTAARPKLATAVKLHNGFTVGIAGVQHYRLFVPPGVRPTGRMPLLVMLHGCAQTAEAFATSTRMNQIAAKEGFAVLYPDQNHLA